MATDLRITKKQVEAIERVVNYIIDDERDHLEETIETEIDLEVSDLTDDDLYDLKTTNEEIINNKNLQSHIWWSLFELSNIKTEK